MSQILEAQHVHYLVQYFLAKLHSLLISTQANGKIIYSISKELKLFLLIQKINHLPTSIYFIAKKFLNLSFPVDALHYCLILGSSHINIFV